MTTVMMTNVYAGIVMTMLINVSLVVMNDDWMIVPG